MFSNTGTGTPTGQVSLLTSKGSPAGTFTLTNGSVPSTTTLLPGGNYNVCAHYAGDGTYEAFPLPISPGVVIAGDFNGARPQTSSPWNQASWTPSHVEVFSFLREPYDNAHTDTKLYLTVY